MMTSTVAPASCAIRVTSAMAAVASRGARGRRWRGCAHRPDTTYSMGSDPRRSRAEAPLGLATRAENSTPSKRFSSTARSSASANAGTFDGGRTRWPPPRAPGGDDGLEQLDLGGQRKWAPLDLQPVAQDTSRMVTWVIYSTPWASRFEDLRRGMTEQPAVYLRVVLAGSGADPAQPDERQATPRHRNATPGPDVFAAPARPSGRRSCRPRQQLRISDHFGWC